MKRLFFLKWSLLKNWLKDVKLDPLGVLDIFVLNPTLFLKEPLLVVCGSFNETEGELVNSLG